MKLLPVVSQKTHNLTVRLSPLLAKTNPDFFAGQLRNPIFVIGSARSGTTLLAGLLGQHPQVAHWSEANQIWDPTWYPWRPENRGRWPMEYDPEAFTRRWWGEAQPRQQQIRATFGAYQWLKRKPYFLNKSPFHTFRLPHLRQMFPQARFIHLIRDGRAVVYSYARRLQTKDKLREWPEPQQTEFENSFDELALWLSAFWKAGLAEVARQDEQLGLSRAGLLSEMTYEQLCADTASTLTRLWRHTGLDAADLRPVTSQTTLKDQNYKWQQALDPKLVDQMTAAMEPLLTQHRYETSPNNR